MSVLTVRREWLEPGFLPGSFDESPFEELAGPGPAFPAVAKLGNLEPAETVLELAGYGRALAHVVRELLEPVPQPIHLMLSGGYDSRALAAILEETGKEPLYVTDGTQDPACAATLDYLRVPEGRRWQLDLSADDPYGILDAQVEGWAPLYTAMNFLPTSKDATLITGLGGGEWFSYPAADWHRGKPRRLEHTSLVNMWLDCWPQYTLIDKAWSNGYADALHPYTTWEYADLADQCKAEWLHENTGLPALDAVRLAMLNAIDTGLAGLGWEPHRYDFRLTAQQSWELDHQASRSWLWDVADTRSWGKPSMLTRDVHAATMAGFAQWCEKLKREGNRLTLG